MKIVYHYNDIMGLSENSVPLNPMVLLIIIPMKNGYFIGNINPLFSDKPILIKSQTICVIEMQHKRFCFFAHGSPLPEIPKSAFEDRISGKPVESQVGQGPAVPLLKDHKKTTKITQIPTSKNLLQANLERKNPSETTPQKTWKSNAPPAPPPKKRGKSATFPKLHQVTIATATTTTATSPADQPTAASAKQGAQRLPVA